MKKFVVMLIMVVLVIGTTGLCEGRAHYFRCMDDDRVTFGKSWDENCWVGKTFRFDVTGVPEGYFTIYRHAEGVDDGEIVWFGYASSSADEIDMTREIMTQMDFCLEVLDRHGWE